MSKPLKPKGSGIFTGYWSGMEPSGCRWCGHSRNTHGRRYSFRHGVHSWAPASKEQTLYRMLRRRYDVKRWQR